MNSIPDTQSPGLLQDRGNLQSSKFSSHSRKQSVNAYESLKTGLTIKTREGDIVTLSSNSFSELNAFEYNSRGEIRTDSANARISQHTREITLTTGEQFSFSVQGDLNEQELADIEAIVKGVDSITAEVIQGDMDGAFEKALSMGNYSSVSMYSAEISHQRSYSVAEETRSTSLGPLAGSDPALGTDGGNSQSSLPVDSFVEKMAQLIEDQEEKMLAKAQQPLSALFEQLLKNREEADERETPAYDVLKNMGKAVEQLVDDLLKKAFDTTLNGLV
jgi:hypothetical protein